jgi:Ca-activated chloride channel family protein
VIGHRPPPNLSRRTLRRAAALASALALTACASAPSRAPDATTAEEAAPAAEAPPAEKAPLTGEVSEEAMEAEAEERLEAGDDVGEDVAPGYAAGAPDDELLAEPEPSVDAAAPAAEEAPRFKWPWEWEIFQPKVHPERVATARPSPPPPPRRLDDLPALRMPGRSKRHAERFRVNPTVTATAEPTVSLRPTAGTASWEHAARSLRDGALPPAESVHPEGFANRFAREPAADVQDVALRASLFPSPFRRGYHALVLHVAAPTVGGVRPGALAALVDVSGRDDESLAAARALVDELGARRGDLEVLAWGTGGRRRAAGDLHAGPAPDLPQVVDRYLTAHDGDDAPPRVLLVDRGGLATVPAQVLYPAASTLRDAANVTLVSTDESSLSAPRTRELAAFLGAPLTWAGSDARARELVEDGALDVWPIGLFDLGLRVRFDPTVVERYRLIGYEHLADAKARATRGVGAALPAGDAVALVFEVKLRREGTLGEADLLWRRGAGSVEVSTLPLAPGFLEATPRHRLIASATAFAEKLRGSWWSRAYGYEVLERELGTLDLDDARHLRALVAVARERDRRGDPFVSEGPLTASGYDHVPEAP